MISFLRCTLFFPTKTLEILPFFWEKIFILGQHRPNDLFEEGKLHWSNQDLLLDKSCGERQEWRANEGFRCLLLSQIWEDSRNKLHRLLAWSLMHFLAEFATESIWKLNLSKVTYVGNKRYAEKKEKVKLYPSIESNTEAHNLQEGQVEENHERKALFLIALEFIQLEA